VTRIPLSWPYNRAVRIASTALILAASIAHGESAVQRLLEDKMLYDRIKALDASLNGVLGVAAIDLTTGRVFAYNGDAEFPTASSIKIPILIEMFRQLHSGAFRLTDNVTLTPAESVGGSGELQNSLKRGPVTLTVQQLITAMIEHSDNTATNKCIAMVRMERVNHFLDEHGFHATRLRRIMMDTAAAERGDENTSTPREMARLVEMLYEGRAVDAPSSRQMLDIMKLVKAGVRGAVPPEIPVASKPGDLDGVHCETGVVYLPGRPFVVSIFSTFLEEGANPVPDVTKIALDYFRKLAGSNAYGHKIK
jgi:beta-lactamase class A